MSTLPYPFPIISTFRSKVESYSHCKRKRFLSYEIDLGESYPIKGIAPTRLSIPLTTGSCGHTGMETLLLTGDIEAAVSAALDQYRVTVTGADFLIEPMKGEEGTGLAFGSEVMKWTISQEMAIVESGLRGFHASTWKWFKEKYEILSVEKDMAIEIEPGFNYLTKTDALVQDRETGDLILQSFKFLARWDWRSQVSYKYDRQNLSEPWGVEQKMKEWWGILKDYLSVSSPGENELISFMLDHKIPLYMKRFISRETPPEIYLVQMGIIKKGARKPDEKRGPGYYIQYSPLITGYVNPSRVDSLGPDNPDCYAWSWDVPKVNKDGETYVGSLGYTNWKRMFVWETIPGGVKQWVEWLEQDKIQPEVTKSVFNECFDFSEPMNKRADHISRWKDGMVYQEKMIQQHAEHVNKLIREGKWQEAVYVLDLLFPPDGKCITYGGLCPMVPVCWDNPGFLYNLLGSGIYKPRESHHELEGGEEE